MKNLKRFGFLLLILLVGIQFIPTSNNQSSLVPKTDFMTFYRVPINIRQTLKISCYNCHSNNTDYPWYSHIQPISYLLEKHIREGKKELNFNTFGNFSTRRQKSKLEGISNQLKDDKMPLSIYTFIHRKAMLSKIQKKQLLDWIDHLKDSL